MAFEGNMREVGSGAAIDLHGEIDGSADEALNAVYTAAVGTGAKTVLLNFGEVSYINSTGIALIVGILAQARKSSVNVVAYGLSEHYREIFEITRLVDFVTLYEDEASAVGAATR